MYLVWDGFKSLIVAVVAIFICGAPVALGVHALMGWAIPDWFRIPAWASLVILSGVGLILTVAFLRKAWNGISPTRSRKR